MSEGGYGGWGDLWLVSLEHVGNSPWEANGTLEIRMGACLVGFCLPTTECCNDTQAFGLNRYDPGENVGKFALCINNVHLFCLTVRVGPFESREDYLAVGGSFQCSQLAQWGAARPKMQAQLSQVAFWFTAFKDVLRILEVPEKTTGEIVALCRDEAQRLQERIASGELVYFAEIACRNQVNLILALIAQKERQMYQATE